MDAVHEAEQSIDIGVCSQHNRIFECYCTQCYCLICPSCLMFDTHKGHEVCKIEEGAKDLRVRINNSAREGLLKFEKTQSVLLDIRHAKLSLEENSQNIIKYSEKCFDDLIVTIKNRKAKFLEEVRTHFNQQIQFVEGLEKQWLEKQEVSQKILKLQSSNDDIKIMQEAGTIIHGLQQLSQPIEYKELKLVESVENDIVIGKHKYNFNEMTEALKDYLKKGRLIVNKIKC